MIRRMLMAQQNPSREETALRERIRFLLPPVVAIGLMIALAFMVADALAISVRRDWFGVVVCVAMEAALLANVIARRRLQRRLLRLFASRCLASGYNLTANTAGLCSKCGKPRSAGVKA